MTGKDLIILILENNLLDEPVYENHKLIGCVTPDDVAERFGVGTASVNAWIDLGWIKSVNIEGVNHIPIDCKRPIGGINEQIN